MTQNNALADEILRALLQKGVREFSVAPGSRNAPFVQALSGSTQTRCYIWPEERSAGFFALGRIKATGKPVAVIVTSGTAAAELLPAVMEAHYSGLPLVVVTADRPRRLRGTGAPQTAEQKELYSVYTEHAEDLAEGERCRLETWQSTGPAHLNVCFEEPSHEESRGHLLDAYLLLSSEVKTECATRLNVTIENDLKNFLAPLQCPLVLVGALEREAQDAVREFLHSLKLPVYLEGLSGIREDPLLKTLRIRAIDQAWKFSKDAGYPLDGIIRIGEMPTARLWRDLDQRNLPVLSICPLSFKGLSACCLLQMNLKHLPPLQARKEPSPSALAWIDTDRHFAQQLENLFMEEPLAEPSLIHTLSSRLPLQSKIYLGNSLPIREWDLAATLEPRSYQIAANRGLNGIDGQIATFLGYSSPEQENWALIGDLTALYDMAGFWIGNQMDGIDLNLIIVNNQGGQIFSRLFQNPLFLNSHQLEFDHLAAFWKWGYEKWTQIPEKISGYKGRRLIELTPDPVATRNFWKKYTNFLLPRDHEF